MNVSREKKALVAGMIGCLLYVIGDFLFAAIGKNQSAESIGLPSTALPRVSLSRKAATTRQTGLQTSCKRSEKKRNTTIYCTFCDSTELSVVVCAAG